MSSKENNETKLLFSVGTSNGSVPTSPVENTLLGLHRITLAIFSVTGFTGSSHQQQIERFHRRLRTLHSSSLITPNSPLKFCCDLRTTKETLPKRNLFRLIFDQEKKKPKKPLHRNCPGHVRTSA
ncbi:hypothetical protein U1Q18_047387 [Sarracenia purpurea var. burkii]